MAVTAETVLDFHEFNKHGIRHFGLDPKSGLFQEFGALDAGSGPA